MDEFESTWSEQRERSHLDREAIQHTAMILAGLSIVRRLDARRHLADANRHPRLPGVALLDESDDSQGGGRD